MKWPADLHLGLSAVGGTESESLKRAPGCVLLECEAISII